MWPFLLKYPRNKVAIIDDVCMIHPRRHKEPGTSLYEGALGAAVVVPAPRGGRALSSRPCPPPPAVSPAKP